MKFFSSLVFASVASRASATWSPSNPKPPSYPADTCSKQFDCIDWQVRKLATSSCSCGSCAIEVCLVLDLNTNGDNPACVKSSGSLDHACDMADSKGCPRWKDTTPWDYDGLLSPLFNLLGFYDSTCGGPSDGFKMCQIGKPGDSLSFIL